MSVYDGDAEQRGRASIAVLTPITIPFGSLISIGRSPALTDLGNAAVECSFAISTGTKPSLPTPCAIASASN